jgi:hypothetical protein
MNHNRESFLTSDRGLDSDWTNVELRDGGDTVDIDSADGSRDFIGGSEVVSVLGAGRARVEIMRSLECA